MSAAQNIPAIPAAVPALADIVGGTPAGVPPSTPAVSDLDPRRYAELVRRIAGAHRSRGYDPDSAQDNLHEAIFVMLKTNRGPSSPDKLESYLFEAAMNKARERHRKGSRVRTSDDDAGLGEWLASVELPVGWELEQAELRAAILTAVAELPDHLAAVVELFMNQVTQLKIAETLCVHPNTVRKWLQRAREQLGTRLRDFCPGGRTWPASG